MKRSRRLLHPAWGTREGEVGGGLEVAVDFFFDDGGGFDFGDEIAIKGVDIQSGELLGRQLGEAWATWTARSAGLGGGTTASSQAESSARRMARGLTCTLPSPLPVPGRRP